MQVFDEHLFAKTWHMSENSPNLGLRNNPSKYP